MTLEWDWWKFFWGAVGAAAPEALRLYKIVTSGLGTLPPFSWSYYLISLLFLVFGGMFAAAWGEDNALKCLWVGVSLPVIISSLAAQVPSGSVK